MVWTNAVGVAFTATLLAAGDGGATFVFPEDGATNVLPLAKLSDASARRVCRLTGYQPVPPAVAALYRQAKISCDRLDGLLADGRIAPEDAATRRARVFEAFNVRCRERGLSDEDIQGLRRRLSERSAIGAKAN